MSFKNYNFIMTSTLYKEGQSEIPYKLVLKPGDELSLNAGNFQVQDLLGEGGFGSVYAIQEENGDPPKSYAIKILDLYKAMPTDYENLKMRFSTGFSAGQVRSNYVVRNYFYGSILGNPYIIMDLCSNEDLSKKIAAFYAEREYTELAIAILKGLKAIHDKGIVHRDIKPQNILFEDEETPKISDFDIAEYMENPSIGKNIFGFTKDVWGTPVYAPPEQLDHLRLAKCLAPALDIFAFGITMYEVITQGHFPYGNSEDFQKNPKKFYRKVKREKPVPISKYRKISPEWIKLVEGCIEPNPKNRIQNTAEVLSFIDNLEVEKRKEAIWMLEIVDGEGVGKRYNLTELMKKHGTQVLRLGSSNAENNEIAIEEKNKKYVSRSHATLKYTADKQWQIKDGQTVENGSKTYWKESTNGTEVNKLEIKGSESFYPLKPGDIVILGQSIFLRLDKI